MYHHANQQLVDPHVLGDGGTFSVALQSVRIVWSTLARGVVANLRAGAVLRALAHSLHEQCVGLKRLGAAEGADVEAKLVGYNGERSIAMVVIPSGYGGRMLSASDRACGVELVVVKKYGTDRCTVELVSRKLGEVADTLDVYVVETAHANNKGTSSLNRGEYGSTSFTDGSCTVEDFGQLKRAHELP